jgi:MFS family permease
MIRPLRHRLTRDRDLHVLVGAVGLSALGDFLALIPLALAIHDRTGSGLAVAALFVALWGPVALLGGPAGLLVDRVESRRLLVWVSVAQAAAATALAFVDGLAPILVFTALLGTGFAVSQPAEFALIPAAAGEDRLAVANGRVETARYVGFTLGPLIGGALAAAGGTRLALLLNAATFVIVAAGAASLRCRRRPAPRRDDGRERARDGLMFLVRHATLGPVMAVAVFALLFMTAAVAAELFFAKDVLRVGDVGYGALIAVWTLGMAVGSMAVVRRVAVASFASAALVAIAVQGAGLALPTLWLVFGFALAAYLVGGVAHGVKNVMLRTLLHTEVPDALRGRAFAAYNSARNAAELAALLGGGVLIAVLGARWTLFLAGALPLLAAAAVLARRWMPARPRLASE